jgi:transposase-like protein
LIEELTDNKAPNAFSIKDDSSTSLDFPAKHWQSIRTSNPIESTFSAIRYQTKRYKRCLSRDGMLHMIFKLGLCAEEKWRRLRGFNYLAKVITRIELRGEIEVQSR